MNSDPNCLRVLCCGTFDHFHLGHESFLKQAAALGKELYVVVARDENVIRIKGRAPDNNEEKRKFIVDASGIADVVKLGNRGTKFLQIVKDINPDIIALGYDQNPPQFLSETFPKCKIITLESYCPEIYKSSLYRQALQ